MNTPCPPIIYRENWVEKGDLRFYKIFRDFDFFISNLTMFVFLLMVLHSPNLFSC